MDTGAAEHQQSLLNAAAVALTTVLQPKVKNCSLSVGGVSAEVGKRTSSETLQLKVELKVELQWCYSEVNSGVTVVLKLCYSGVTVG